MLDMGVSSDNQSLTQLAKAIQLIIWMKVIDFIELAQERRSLSVR